MTHLINKIVDIFDKNTTKEGYVLDISKNDYIIKLNTGEIVRAKIQQNVNVIKGDSGVLILGTPNIFIPVIPKSSNPKRIYI